MICLITNRIVVLDFSYYILSLTNNYDVIKRLPNNLYYFEELLKLSFFILSNYFVLQKNLIVTFWNVTEFSWTLIPSTFHFVLFCFVSFCFVLFRFVSFCFVLFRFVSFCFVSFCFVLFRFVPHMAKVTKAIIQYAICRKVVVAIINKISFLLC